jgi:hypothetical protein
MTGQSLVKHFLTEGDKFLVSRLSPLEDQGGYAIASNYGMFLQEYALPSLNGQLCQVLWLLGSYFNQSRKLLGCSSQNL